ncbi:hypothetical protein D039_0561B, partial [Vibrio parahaemolyticus EKP-028]
SFVGKGVLSQP